MSCKSLIAAFAATIVASACSQPMKSVKINYLPTIPDAAYAKGVSAPFCGFVGDTLVLAGGANFPDKPLLEGGAKRVYADIWALHDGVWTHAGCLPDSVAYGATFSVGDALVFAGGNVRGETTAKVYKIELREGKALISELPPLPVPMEQCAWSQHSETLFLAGQEGVFCCKAGEYKWKKLADSPEAFVQPVAFATADKLYLWGGFNPQTLLAPPDGCSLDLNTLEWSAAPSIPDGGTFVGATGVTLPDGTFAVAGGVNRSIFERALRNTPEDRIPYLSHEPAWYKFRKEIFVFDPDSMQWSTIGSFEETALAGPGMTARGDSIIVSGGELKPGVRSPRTISLNL